MYLETCYSEPAILVNKHAVRVHLRLSYYTGVGCGLPAEDHIGVKRAFRPIGNMNAELFEEPFAVRGAHGPSQSLQAADGSRTIQPAIPANQEPAFGIIYIYVLMLSQFGET